MSQRITDTRRSSAPRRFPRTDLVYDWKYIPRLDVTKVKRSEWLIDFFLAQAGIQLVYGKQGTRKTTAMLQAAWSVSQGQRFLGRATKPRCVLFLDYENPADVLKSYCSDLHIDPMSSAFTIWDRSADAPPGPADEKLIKFVQRCKRKTGHAPWIIFDSWTSLLKMGESGDKIGEATPIFRAVRHLCDIGATCTIIDHTGHKGKLPIGTSAKMTQMDTAHYFQDQSVRRSPLDSQSRSAIIRVESFLKRYAPKDVGTFSFELKADLDRKGDWHLTSMELTKDRAVIKLETRIEALKGLIKKYPLLGQEELSEKAAAKDICGSKAAREMLQGGIGKHWKVLPSGSKKKLFRVLD